MQLVKTPHFQFTVLVAIIVAIDFVSKLWILNQDITYTQITSFLTIAKTYNYGASFSLAAGYGTQANYGFLVFGIIICCYLSYQVYFRKPLAENQTISLGLIIGGAIGNLLDRVRFGAVLDFISVHYERYYFPTFNVADIAISLGATLYLVTIITMSKKHQ